MDAPDTLIADPKPQPVITDPQMDTNKIYEQEHERPQQISDNQPIQLAQNDVPTIPTLDTHHIVQAPDGAKVAFPKGTPPDTMHQEMTKWWQPHLQRTVAAWDSVRNAASNAAQAIGLPSDMPEWQKASDEFVRDPIGTTGDVVGAIIGGLTHGANAVIPSTPENNAMIARAQAEYAQGNHLAAAVTLTPLVGDGLAKAVKQAQARDYSGSLGTAAGVVAPFLTESFKGEAELPVTKEPAYAGEERRAGAPEQPAFTGTERRGALMSPTQIENNLKTGQPVTTPFDNTEGAMDTINRDLATRLEKPKSPTPAEDTAFFNKKEAEQAKPGVSVSEMSDRPEKKVLSIKVDGARAGQMSLTPAPELGEGAMEVSTAQLKPEFQGKGHGSAAYQQAIEYAKSKGANALYSDDQVSTKANRVWQSLVDRGVATVDQASGRYKIDLSPTAEDADAAALKKALSGSAGENALYAKAKAELGPEATPSEVAQHAQAMKNGTPVPKTNAAAAGRSVGAASINDLNTKEDVPTFYSKAEQIINDKVSNNASGDSIKALLKNNGVKDDEMKWAGLDEFLKDKPKVSKAELQQFIKENQIQLKDVDLGKTQRFTTRLNEAETDNSEPGRPVVDVIDPTNGLVRFTGDESAAQDYMAELGQGLSHDEEVELLTLRREGEQLRNNPSAVAQDHYRQNVLRQNELLRKQEQGAPTRPTQYDKWTVPGERENYQEKLITLPTKESPELQGLRKEYNDAAKARDNYVLNGQLVPGDVEIRFQDAQNAMRKMKNEESTSRDYVAPHFGGSGGKPTNIVAHVRFDDRPAVDGKKTLFMEEAQSDWHSAGRHEGYKADPKAVSKADDVLRSAKDAKTTHVQSVVDRVNAERKSTGYATPEEINELHDLETKQNTLLRMGKPADEQYRARIADLRAKQTVNEEGLLKINPNSEQMSWQIRNAMTPEEQAKFDTLNIAVNKAAETKRDMMQGAVPDAPFKQSWHELVMKRMLREAAEKGYDRLAWTTGDQQAGLYDLSKHIGRIEYDPENNELHAFDPQGKKVIDENVWPTVKDLTPYVGAEHAENLVGQIENYHDNAPGEPDPDMFYDSARENYDIEEREVPDENHEFETVQERHDYDERVRELAAKYKLPDRAVAQLRLDLHGVATPQEAAEVEKLRQSALNAEQEQEDERPTYTQYFVTDQSGDDVSGPHDTQRAAEHDMQDRIDSDVRYEMDNYEAEKPDLPEISGLDLKHGGEFHRLLYDKMIPSFLKKYAKKWGAEVGTTEIKGMGEPEERYISSQSGDLSLAALQSIMNGNEAPDGTKIGGGEWSYQEKTRLKELYNLMSSGESFKNAMVALFKTGQQGMHGLAQRLGGQFIKSIAAPAKVHSIEITPAMRQSVMKEGQPIAKKDDKKKKPFAAPQEAQVASNFRPSLAERMKNALS